METPPLPASGGLTSDPVCEHVVFQTETKPLRFQGWLLGRSDVVSQDREGYYWTTRARLFRTLGGKFVWATQRFGGTAAPEEEPHLDKIEHSEAIVHSTAAEAWESRPSHSAKVTQATTKAWCAAAENDQSVRELLYEDVD